MSKGRLREVMPVVTAWIDDLRRVFGEEYIDRIIKAGMSGKPVFYASENGHVIGTHPAPSLRIGTDEKSRGTRFRAEDGLTIWRQE